MEPSREHNARGGGNLGSSTIQSGWTTRFPCCPAFQEEVAGLFQRLRAPSGCAAPSAFLLLPGIVSVFRSSWTVNASKFNMKVQHGGSLLNKVSSDFADKHG